MVKQPKNGSNVTKLTDLIVRLIKDNGLQFSMDEDDFQTICQKSAKILFLNWLKLMTSDWLTSVLYSFLSMAEIIKLDTSMCNHSARPDWLKCLEKNLASKKYYVKSDKTIEWCNIKNIQFENICFDDKSKVTNDGIFKLARLCNSSLKSINIGSFVLDKKGFQYFGGHCPSIEILTLKSTSLSDLSLTSIGNGCKLLKNIVIYDPLKTVTNIGLKRLIKNCKLLTHFSYKGIDTQKSVVTDEILSSLAMYCPLLETVELGSMNITDTNIDAFAKGCKYLKSVFFEEALSVSIDVFLKSFGIYTPLLERLVIHTWPRPGVIVNDIDDNAMKIFTTGCPMLYSLSIRCYTIKPQGMMSLVTSCPFLSIVDVSLSSITDDALIILGKLHSLKQLQLNDCQLITDEGIEGVVKESRSLEKIIAFNCPLLTDDSCAHIADGCPHLRSIDIGKCGDGNNLTSMGIIFLFNKCTHLYDLVANPDCIPGDIKIELDNRKKNVFESESGK